MLWRVLLIWLLADTQANAKPIGGYPVDSESDNDGVMKLGESWVCICSGKLIVAIDDFEWSV